MLGIMAKPAPLIQECEQMSMQNIHGSRGIASVNDTRDVDFTRPCKIQCVSLVRKNIHSLGDYAHLEKSSRD